MKAFWRNTWIQDHVDFQNNMLLSNYLSPEQLDYTPPIFRYGNYHSNTQICRIKGCGGAGCPPPPPQPILFERLKLPQQIIHLRKGNLSESPNHFKYRKNILISRFYEQFSPSSRILSHFWKYEKISNS